MVEWVKSAERPQWLGYAVPAISSGRHTCCGNSGGDWSNGNYGNCGPCRLENGANANSYNVERGEIKLEGPSNVVVLLRAEGRKIGRARAVSEDCVVDAGGLQVLWLSGVKPADSVRLLERYVDSKELEERGGERLGRSALMAIAMLCWRSMSRSLRISCIGSCARSLRLCGAR